MSELNITLKVSCMFNSEQQRETIVETVRAGAEHVMANMLMIIPTGSRVRPYVTMVIEELGEEDRIIDIAKEMKQAVPADYEDPFA